MKDLHVRRKCIQSLVKVVHLNQYARSSHNTKHVSARVCELVVPGEGEFDCNAEAFDRHDRNGADHGADGDVYDRVCASILGDNDENHEDAKHSNCEAVQHKT